MIDAIDLHKFFGNFHAVRGITLQVPAGEVIALLGPNGAGKSTTVRLLTGLLQPTAGRARVAGFDVAREAQSVRSQVGLLTEYPGLYGRMSALDYLHFFARLQGLDRGEAELRARSLLVRFGLWKARERRLSEFSKGMQQKVALIRSMLHNPHVLFLDEPTTAMDPHSARVVRDAIAELRDDRRVIVLCTHNLAEAEALAGRIVVIRSGQIVAEGTPAQLRRRWLGEPTWELQATGAIDAAVDRLRDLVACEQIEGNRLRYRTSDPHQLNPTVLERLHEAGVAVVALGEVSPSLEDVYLRIAGQREDAA